jgi:hypothetical protein
VIAWSPIALLPNVSAKESIEGEGVAFASVHDVRVDAIRAEVPLFADWLTRFTDAFGVPIEPVVLIIRADMVTRLNADALLSFRDLVAMSVVPLSRAMNTVYPNSNRIVYSDSFWIYPWTLNTDLRRLVATTPAFTGFHVVEQFHGQSSPELPHMTISKLDTQLLEKLLERWKRHYLGRRSRWEDRALFRSLNMATQAAKIPAGVGSTIFDIGRMISLWVSAFEILSHPRVEGASLLTVYRIFEGVHYYDRSVGRRQYAAYISERVKNKRKKAGLKRARHPLPCWIYGKLYQARNHFLHGNPIPRNVLNPKGTKTGLFWLAPPLYRLALTGFLNLSVDPSVRKKLPYRFSDLASTNTRLRKLYLALDSQSMSERALLSILK